MRHRLTIVLLAAIAAIAASLPAVAGSAPSTPGATVDPRVSEALTAAPSARVIVTLRTDAAANAAIARGDVPAIERANAVRSTRLRAALPGGARLLRSYRAVPAIVLDLPAAAIDALRTHPDVAHVALDGRMYAQLDETVPLINADDVHATLEVDGSGVTVAVLDTGIETDHPALADAVTGQGCFIISGGCPTAAGVPGSCGPNANTTGAWAEDGHGHGSHVSGIVTSDGKPNGDDVGIAPGASIKAFKVLDDCGYGDFANLIDVLDAILTSHPDVRVINMSVGDGTENAPGTCEDRLPALTTAIATARAAGILIFASSGNAGHKDGVTYPACIDDVVSVGAVYDAPGSPVAWPSCVDISPQPNKVGCFSQSGVNLDLLAPGGLIEAPWAGGQHLALTGTSMSSPAAAAVAALVISDEPSLTPDEVEQRLKITGMPITDPANGITTCRVDAFRAVAYSGPLCLASPLDSDGDGCADAEEATHTPATGGLRDPQDFWDFYDVTNDKSIDLADTLSVLAYFGDAALPATPADLRDREMTDPVAQPWRTAEADDGIDLRDAIANLRSFGNSCALAP
jgi:subtilisin family serine protease